MRTRLLGVPIDVLRFEDAVATVLSWRERPASRTAHFCNVHLLVTAADSPAVREVLEGGDLNATDGMPLVWLARRRGVPGDRVPGPDLMLAVMDEGRAGGATHYLYGSGPGVAERLAGQLAEKLPGLRIVGTWSPSFRPQSEVELAADLERIQAASPDYVWAGLGAPKQESWVEAARGQLQVAGLLAVGAAFDFHSGTRRRAQRWMQRAGLEWLFRLIIEPRRLWRRYAVTNTRFLVLVASEALDRARHRS